MRSLLLLGLLGMCLSTLSACGQSGALVKASAQQDKRSNYLLYPSPKSVMPEQNTPLTSPSSDSALGQQP